MYLFEYSISPFILLINLYLHPFFLLPLIYLRLPVKSRYRHIAQRRRPGTADLACDPPSADLSEILRQRPGRPAEPDAPELRRFDALSLSLPDVPSLVLRHKRQHLQHDVAQERPHQILSSPGVQKGHVQHDDGGLTGLGDAGPLLQNLGVVPAQAVDAFDHQNVPRLEGLDQLLVQRTRKIFPGLLFHDDVRGRNAELLQGDQLAVLLLTARGHSGVAVHVCCHSKIPLSF